MYILNMLNATKSDGKRTQKEFICENCYRQTGFTKESSYYSMKH